MYNETSNIIKVNEYIVNHKKEFNKEIGLLIKKIRIQKRISIKYVSERTMMSDAYIKQIEAGIYGISLSKFIIICNALEIEPNSIIENYILGCKKNEDLFYNNLQKSKNLSENILDFMKEKEDGYLEDKKSSI